MIKNLVFLLAVAVATGARSEKKRSVVLLIADDLRPEIGCYECSRVKTPRLDGLARDGWVFRRAYSQIALCAPSRNSFLSGRRPDSTRAYQFIDHFRTVGENWTALPEAFRRAGYTTVGCGKVYHPNLPPRWDVERSWSFQNASEWLYPSEPRCPNNASWCALSDDEVYEDAQTTAKALELLNGTKAPSFFVAVGFRKPHLLWRFPKRVLDLYSFGEDPLAERLYAPVDAPALAYHMPFSELRRLSDFEACGGALAMAPDFAYPFDCQRAWRRANAAATTFMDELVGTVLDAIPDPEETLAVFTSDHGWHLGDQGEWEKFTNYESATRVPLIIRAPWLSGGGVVKAIVELVDLFPTMTSLAGVDVAYTSRESAPLQGRDLSPIFRGEPFKSTVALSQFPRCVGGENYHEKNESYPLYYLNDCNDVPRANFTHMGFSIRTEDWRYTEWRPWDGERGTPEVVARELYDHRLDDGTCSQPLSAFDHETVNLADNPAAAETVAKLHAQLTAAFRLPSTDAVKNK